MKFTSITQEWATMWVKALLIELCKRITEKHAIFQEIEKTLDRDRFMSAQEALKFGLVDKIETHSGSMPSDWTSP